MKWQNKLKGYKEIRQFDNGWWLTFTRILFPKEQLNVYRYRGLEILTDHAAGDANGAREVLTSPMYRRFFKKIPADRRLNVLDLGANNGGFPLLLKASGYKLKKVVSVELNPNTFMRLQFNLQRNLDCDLAMLNAAVCGEERWLDLRLGAGGVSDDIYTNGQTSGTAYRIRGVTLDQLYAEHFAGETIDICKIDVEAAEFEVFASAHHESLRRCRFLIMEIHERNGRTATEILPVIERLGLELQPFEPDADASVHFFIIRPLA